MPRLRLVFVDRSLEADVGPTAYVHVETWESPPYVPRRQDKLLLTRPTSTWGEFSQELNRLCHELEELRREAELRFANCAAKRYEPPRNDDQQPQRSTVHYETVD
jgi:hypothetical protein